MPPVRSIRASLSTSIYSYALQIALHDFRAVPHFYKLCCLLQVLLGYPYDQAIDMWSVGCVALELFFGMPLFPGASEFDMLIRITEMFGLPPEEVLKSGRNVRKYFACDD